MNWFDEALHDEWSGQGYTQRFEVTRTICEVSTGHQKLVIFETPRFGRVLALDGVIQTTEADEFCYHEMLAHVPIFAHGKVRDALIVGGGDGGVLREVLRHDGIGSATLVEIDDTVINVCREHMPGLSDGAFDDPRCTTRIADGAAFVRDTDRRFDVIIVDSPDPIGPAEALFTPEFYADCRHCLRENGILVTQSGVPFLQPEELGSVHRSLGSVFSDATFYLTVVPTYVGGYMTLGWASDRSEPREIELEELAERVGRTGLSFKYYSPSIHRSAFALPPFIAGILEA